MRVAAALRQSERAVDDGEKLVMADRLLDEIDGTRFHRLHGHRYFAMACDHDRRQAVMLGLEPLQERDSAQSGQTSVNEKASVAPWAMGLEKRLAAGEVFNRVPVSLDRFAHRLAKGIIVVDQKDGRDKISGNRRNRLLLFRWFRLSRDGKLGANQADQRVRFDRLV